MDQKARLWGEKFREKTILETDKPNFTSKENEEVQELLADKEKLEKDLGSLNDKLAFTLSVCNAKDEQVKKQTKIVQEAVAGWEKAEAEMLSMKEHLEESIRQQLVYEERVAHLDGALKECMQQLYFVREEQEQRIYDAVTKASKEFDEVRNILEEQISETGKRLARTLTENSNLSKSITVKDNLIEDMKRQITRAEADRNALMIRLESIEKDNTSLKYETRLLQKELDIRNEEREFNRRTADASYKQHLESAKKVVQLESECQTLRLLVRKRLPSPSALAKMKKEVEIFGQEQLSAVEEENKTLKRSLDRKTNEVQFSRVMLARTASKLLQLQSDIESKGQATLEQTRSNLASQELCSASMSDIGSDDNVSCAESWASALITELERFKSEKQKDSLSCMSVGPSEISLMDDFVEMEKLAVVSNEKSPEISHASAEANNEINALSESKLDEIASEVNDDETSPIKRTRQQSQRDLNKSIGKIIELIEGIGVPSDDIDNSDSLSKRHGNMHSHNNQGMPTGYMVRVFQWKTSDLSDVLQKFLHVCYNLLNGEVDHEKFATELTTALEWIINHCFSIQDVSCMKDAIKKQFDWDETHSENDAEGTGQNQIQELEKIIDSLRLELQTLKESNRILEDQIQNHASINTDTETELKEAYHKILALEVELESRNHYCEELETRSVELQLQLESTKKEQSNLYVNQKNEPLRTERDWEITAASEKLADCQETILNLEKQLKALAARKDVSLFDNVIAAHRRKIANTSVLLKDVKLKSRPSLLDQMLAEDAAKGKFRKANDRSSSPTPSIQRLEKILVLKGLKGQDDSTNANSLAIVPINKSGGRGLWKRLLGKRRKPKRKTGRSF